MAKIGVFTASCPLCKKTLEMIDRMKCYKCSVIEHNLFEKCTDRTCLEKATSYGIKSVPTIVVDGKIAVQGKPTETQLKHYLGL